MHSRFLPNLAAALFFATGISGIHAQTQPAPAEEPSRDQIRQELSALRDAVIQQTRQIDLLTAEIARISRGPGSVPRTVRPIQPVVALPAQPAGVVAVIPTPAPASAALPAIPVAAAPAGPVHEIVKGENLTIIAKKHNTTVDVLEKLNNITDASKIRAGEILKLPPDTVPSPATTTAPSPTPATSTTP